MQDSRRILKNGVATDLLGFRVWVLELRARTPASKLASTLVQSTRVTDYLAVVQDTFCFVLALSGLAIIAVLALLASSRSPPLPGLSSSRHAALRARPLTRMSAVGIAEGHRGEEGPKP